MKTNLYHEDEAKMKMGNCGDSVLFLKELGKKTGGTEEKNHAFYEDLSRRQAGTCGKDLLIPLFVQYAPAYHRASCLQ